MSIEELLEREFGTIPELIRAHAKLQPGHPALIQDDRRLDFAALDARMDRVAASLQRDGLLAGDVIAICAMTSIEYATVFLGALRAGIAVAPLAPSSTSESLASMLVDSGAKRLFLDRSVAPAFATPAFATPAFATPAFATIAARMGGAPISLESAGSTPGAALSLEHWLAPIGSQPRALTAEPEATFNIIYSSGTTGTPKGIVQPNQMRWAHVRRAAAGGYGPQSVTLISTPLYSNTTLVSFFPAIALGGAIVLLAKFDAQKFLALAERERVTHAMLVPVQFQRVMDLPEFDRYDLDSFRMKFCTSAPFSAALKRRVLERWPGGLVEYYGMTEGGGTCILAAHENPDKLNTVGKPAPGHDIRLIDDQGREVAPGETGEVVGHSPFAMMTGYHNQPGKTSESEWVDPSGKRFIRTGDIGRFDEAGFLTLLDRKKDMIISGGFNIYPSDLENELLRHPAVEEAAVVGVPSRQWGETPIAFVVRASAHTEDAEQIRSWVNARVGKTQRLSAVELVDALPRSAIGKVLKRELRDDYTNRSGTRLE